MKKVDKERKILWISFLAGLVFAVAEFLFAIFSHSQSVLMDAVYDTSELIFIALIMFLTPLFYAPISEKHPYGFYQVESIFMIIKCIMILSVTFGVSAEIIQSALSGGNVVNESQISLFQFVLGVISIGIYYLLKRMDKSLISPTVDAELMEWKLDIGYSLGLSLAFYASTFLEQTRLAVLAPYFDPVVAIFVMLGMVPQTVRMLLGAIRDIFLFSPDDETVDQIKKICSDIMDGTSLSPVFWDITRTGRHLWVSVYFETTRENLPVEAMKQVNTRINKSIKESFSNCSCELILAP